MKVYIKFLTGMNELDFLEKDQVENACVELTGGMVYGCIDAALLYFVQFCDYVTKPEGLGLKHSKVDPCRFYQKLENGTPEIILIAYYVDDCLIMGRQESVNEMKARLTMEFGTVEDGKLRKLLGM